jgi:hypothetical protein
MLEAVQQIRRMRGGSQAHLMRASDGNYYVTKFQNNPQDLRVLANEYIATKLAAALGLPVPPVEVLQVSDWLIRNTDALKFELGRGAVPVSSGLALGSRFAADPATDFVCDYLPESMMPKIRNFADFARVLVLDKWTGNADGRQAVFTKRQNAQKYNVSFIDQGYCFNAGAWDFPDTALRGVYARNQVYSHVTGWKDFEPALTHAENFDAAELWEIAEGVPEEWTRTQHQSPDSAANIAELCDQIYRRRAKIRDLITAFRSSSRNPFPNWIN